MKYVGDEVFAVWGAPIPSTDHPALALECAMAIQALTPELNAELRERGAPEVAFGIGLNTGEAVAAHFGGRFRRQYDVVGDTVNVGAPLVFRRRPGGDHPLGPGAPTCAEPTAGRAGREGRAEGRDPRHHALARRGPGRRVPCRQTDPAVSTADGDEVWVPGPRTRERACCRSASQASAGAVTTRTSVGCRRKGSEMRGD